MPSSTRLGALRPKRVNRQLLYARNGTEIISRQIFMKVRGLTGLKP